MDNSAVQGFNSMNIMLSSNVKFSCSKDCHWYREVSPKAVCLCGKEKLRKETKEIEVLVKVKRRKK